MVTARSSSGSRVALHVQHGRVLVDLPEQARVARRSWIVKASMPRRARRSSSASGEMDDRRVTSDRTDRWSRAGGLINSSDEARHARSIEPKWPSRRANLALPMVGIRLNATQYPVFLSAHGQ